MEQISAAYNHTFLVNRLSSQLIFIKDNILNKRNENIEPVTTALLLAAGTGSRLYPLTKNEPKCLTSVNGKTILGRMISNLNRQGMKRLVIVTGHLEQCIRDYLGDQIGELKIEYIFSPLYKTTNNIYSLWMAREVINEPFLLLESDLVFDDSLLDEMVYPDRIALAEMQPWMNGTCVTINQSDMVHEFLTDEMEPSDEIKHKTVNIYSFSVDSWRKIIKGLDIQISAGNVNTYYETVFADLISDDNLALKSVSFDSKPWYEIDTLEDLAMAEKIFPAPSNIAAKTAIQIKPNAFYKQIIHSVVSPRKQAGVLNVFK
ncbi:MAG: phosphocholine cytidylyltransferase family protein [Spirochaetaceae bacterium]|nr:phosphocholine cytidylyltransferase family protein [Spirochaetaceae bacterium]